ncbi:placenta-specific protein 9 isoform X2 [Monodon monoceros]|uniref:Placenta-specific protein 9 isoform X2 n=1 Tax=Delphinapterus leucas TaxID=9749 RepID=A0A2Y9PN83_DELLE|nr:placenta-specific protein 9 isoform X2 [Delphinapterus leucas]XP_029056912.1 placenta-specific protein 9 isoform X2 [Monodon monoceros]
MRPLLCALAGLALLRASDAFTAAEPFIPSRGDPARTAGCDRHMAVHGRLDVIEETVEKTVEHLEAEVKGLLAQLEELAWNLPPGPFSLIPDLAEETVSSSGSRDDSLQGWAAAWGRLLHPHGVAWTSQGGSSSSLGQKWEASSGLTASALCPHARGCCSPASDRL